MPTGGGPRSEIRRALRLDNSKHSERSTRTPPQKPIRATTDPEHVVAFDTETTGLHATARLIEIAAIKYLDGREVGRLVTLIDPGERIPYQATSVHGITDRMVRGKPTAAEIAEILL